LIKVHNKEEVIQEEIEQDVTKKIEKNLEKYNNSDSQRSLTKCIPINGNNNQQYFLINSEVTVPEKISFVIKIEYEDDQEGVMVNNTIQILTPNIVQTLSHFLTKFYTETSSMSKTQVFDGLLKTHINSTLLTKEGRNKLYISAENISINRLKSFSTTDRRMIVLDKLCNIIDRKNKKNAFLVWNKTLKVWKKKLNSIKKLLHWNKMKITSRVLNKWYNKFKYEETMTQSVCHRDYVISMYEILGNTKSVKMFSSKYHQVFAFMINRYLKNSFGVEFKKSLKKIILVLKNERNSHWMIDFSEEEKSKVNKSFISPIKNGKTIPDYLNVMMSCKLDDFIDLDTSSPINSGVVTPVDKQIYNEDQDFLRPISPQNYSVLINSSNNQNKGKFLAKLDSNSDYITRQCFENPHCSKITNQQIINEALSNRLDNPKIEDAQRMSNPINLCIVVPIKTNDEFGDIEDDTSSLDLHSYSKNYIGSLEMYFSDSSNKITNDLFENDKSINTLSPIFNLLRDIILHEQGTHNLKDFDDSKIEDNKIEDASLQMDESKASISPSFLEANRKTHKDALLTFNQATKLHNSFSNLLYQVSIEIPKILNCDKSLVLLVVETPNNNMLGGPTKTAYFYSFTDSHTYNFNYDGTFVEKILDSNKPITFTASSQNPNLPSSIRNPAYANYPKNISNGAYHTIRYLPVPVMMRGSSKIIAILETCYTENFGILKYRGITESHNLSKNSVQHIMYGEENLQRYNNDNSYISDIVDEDEKIINIIDQNTSLLSGFADACGKSEIEERRISPDHKNAEFQCTKIIGKRLGKHMKFLSKFCKLVTKGFNKQEKYVLKTKFMKWASFSKKVNDMRIEDYKQELQAKSKAIEELKKTNEGLQKDFSRVFVGINSKAKSLNAKYDYGMICKYTGAVKLIATVSQRLILGNKIKCAFDAWKSDFEVNRIMENAFNKVLEMNHKHISARVASGVSLLNNVFNRQVKYAFEDLCLVDDPLICSRSRSPTPKFKQNMLHREEYSSSLHDSTIYLSRLSNRHNHRRNGNKSMDRTMYLS
jgi:hypothetical protein